MCLEDRPILEGNAAGIDIGAREIFVAVPPDRDARPVRVFSTFTGDLEEMAQWLLRIPVWGYGYINFPRTDINSCRVTSKYGSIFQAHPFPFSAPFAWARGDLVRAGLLGMLSWLGHTCLSFRLR
jgi:hypothetical protein